QGGADPAKLFADRVFTILFGCVGFLVVVALLFTPEVISLLAPGFSDDPGRFTLAVELTRITFPYLLLMSLVTLYGGILNALRRARRRPPSVQRVHGSNARRRGVLSDAGPRRRLGRVHCRHSRSAAGGRRHVAQRRDDGIPLAEMGRGRQTLLPRARARDHRL